MTLPGRANAKKGQQSVTCLANDRKAILTDLRAGQDQPSSHRTRLPVYARSGEVAGVLASTKMLEERKERVARGIAGER